MHAEGAFTAGLAHARTYAAQHGHLATHIPWSVKWQRSYYRARGHVRRHGPLNASDGFPDTHVLTGEWLYLQCTDYSSLHPEQRRLLADIGLTAQAAGVDEDDLRQIAAEALGEVYFRDNGQRAHGLEVELTDLLDLEFEL
ncbi:hypothetical protein AB0E10_39850 [Streptomyces sp. NPDC048045]|uniref:hypothetical protein n=1 Tax=Streptomyces sp. NPDC048045 TaxID=3154710 RepID=UPI00341BA2E4